MIGRNYWKQRREKVGRQTRHRAELEAELARFWRHCKSRIDTSAQERLARLKTFAEVVVGNRHRRGRLRERFNHSKPCRPGSICFVCPKPARVRHHIIQLQHGGDNSAANVVRLCFECHAEIHPWLKRVNNNPGTANIRAAVVLCVVILELSPAFSQGGFASYGAELLRRVSEKDLSVQNSYPKERVDNSRP